MSELETQQLAEAAMQVFWAGFQLGVLLMLFVAVMAWAFWGELSSLYWRFRRRNGRYCNWSSRHAAFASYAYVGCSAFTWHMGRLTKLFEAELLRQMREESGRRVVDLDRCNLLENNQVDPGRSRRRVKNADS
ncbi:hypothetical protein [Chitinolyticbacter meiyuanensis]|uniref:hypothetical protein n=1 Tax=Chitinolyticbacter meiyuanensis TaxID=682798 RepID=UPI0011E5E8A4|nr:hypothetical protein [Chitinolyticbacter meiyuanensis]